MEGRLPYLLLVLQLLLLVPTPSTSFTVKHVFARECEAGLLISRHYWKKFHAFISNFEQVSYHEKNEIRSTPKVRESVIPHKLIREISDHLDDDAWLQQLEKEYLEGGQVNVSTLMETTKYLHRALKEHDIELPLLCVLRDLWWRGLTRQQPEQLFHRVRIEIGLQFFFDVPAVVRAQKDNDHLLGHFLMDMLQFETSAALDVFQHTAGELEMDVELPDDIAEEFQNPYKDEYFYDYESDDYLEDEAVCGDSP